MIRRVLSIAFRTVQKADFSATNQKIVTNYSPFTASFYSTMFNSNVSYEDVKKVGSDKSQALIIDVREPEELKETGVLPGSINIPLGQLENVLRDVPNDVFMKIYGREKPSKHFPIIFSCRSGRRSITAQTVAKQLGFQSVHNYSGGWLDWEEKSK